MATDWDARYRARAGQAEPADLLVSFARFLPGRGRALDLACGAGRNAVRLASHGLEVAGVDLSGEALRQGRELARRQNCRVNWIQADVESFPLASAAFDVITCFYFRAPALYPRIRAALRPGGWLLYETYTLEQLRLDWGPRNPHHLLRTGELLAAFCDWRVIYYRETGDGRAVASLMVQRTSDP